MATITNTALEQEQLVHHDHVHDHDDHEESFVSKYIFSQDHKMISRQFLITAVIMAVVAMTMSIIFRMQLAWPQFLRAAFAAAVVGVQRPPCTGLCRTPGRRLSKTKFSVQSLPMLSVQCPSVQCSPLPWTPMPRT